jgi:hypothetical protein
MALANVRAVAAQIPRMARGTVIVQNLQNGFVQGHIDQDITAAGSMAD